MAEAMEKGGKEGVMTVEEGGGLALAVVFVGTLLAAATGVVGASVVAMGMLPTGRTRLLQPTRAIGRRDLSLLESIKGRSFEAVSLY